MNIESQVTNLELSKRLKELNVKQDSLFYYLNIDEEGKYYIYFNERLPEDFEYEEEPISSFTVSELLKFLPHRITTKENEPYNSYRLRIEKAMWCKENIDVSFSNINLTEYYSVNYISDTTSQELGWLFQRLTKNINDENPANALAKMLIYLYEEEFINVMA